MKVLNIHMSAVSKESEKFDTLISPNATVATLSKIANDCGVEAFSYDAAYPSTEQVKLAIRSHIDDLLSCGDRPVLQFSLLVYNAAESLQFMESLKKEFRNNILCVVGGQLVPYAKQAYIDNPNIDAVCLGDGELLLPELLSDIHDVGTVKPLYAAWLAHNIDPRKRGKYAFVSYDNYYELATRMKAQKEFSGFSQLCIQGLGGPGCSWAANNGHGACDFCALQSITEMNTNSINALTSVEQELEIKYLPDRFYDVSNQFLPFIDRKKNIQWLKEYIASRQEKGISTKKYAYLTVASVDYEIAALLKQAGIEEVYLGIDHFHPPSLKDENKSYRTRARLKQTLDALSQNGINWRTGIVLGSAAEDEDSLKAVEEGVNWLKQNYPNQMKALGVFPVYVLPGSKLYERTKNAGYAQEIISSFEQKGYFTTEQECTLTRTYIEHNSKVSADKVFEFAQKLVSADSANTIIYNYRESPGADALKRR